jgi:amino acid transporter
LGGRGWGWITAWLNLAGLITVLAAINVGTLQFAVRALGPFLGLNWDQLTGSEQMFWQALGMTAITVAQGLVNYRGIHLASRLTDFSGYLILILVLILSASLLIYAPSIDWSRLWTFKNYSGPSGGDVWPQQNSLWLLFALGLLLPAYTITGFDASAHTSEETRNARLQVPRGIIRSVLVSGIAGWIMVSTMVLAMPSMDEAASKGPQVIFWLFETVLPRPLGTGLLLGIIVAQFLCGLATVTSASRMLFAFARDGGVPDSLALSRVSPRYLTPANAIWMVVLLAIAFTLYTPVYSTMTVVCVIFLYLSYVLPLALGCWAIGRTWHEFGPWNLGAWYRPFAACAVLGSIALIWIGIQPPNDQAGGILVACALFMLVLWFGWERRRFRGPPPSQRK